MRVGISATYASSEASFRNAGISRYIRKIVDGLLLLGGEDQYEVFTHSAFEPPESWGGATVRAVAPAGRVARTLWDMRAPSRGFDAWFSTGHVAPLSSRTPRVAMIHDLIPIRHPEYFSRSQAAFLNFQLRHTSRIAERVVTNSEFTKRDIVELAGVSPDKIVVAPLGLGNAVVPVAPYRLDGEAPFLFTLSTLEPRKNLARLVEAMALVRRDLPDLRLVVGGARGWKEGALFDTIQREGLESAVEFLGYVPDEDLAGLFARCAAFVYPSLYEGFGMPVLEAMAAGAPVLTSRGGAMEEVAGAAAAGYFDPTSAESVAGAIVDFVRGGADRPALAARSIARASGFTWENAARITHEAMRDVAA